MAKQLSGQAKSVATKVNARVVLAAIGGLVALVAVVVAVVSLMVLPALGFDGAAADGLTFLQVVMTKVFWVGLVVVPLVLVFEAGSAPVKVAVVGLVGASLVGALLSGVAGVPVVGNIWSFLNRAGHEAKTDYIENLQIVDGQRPAYDERIALDQADFLIKRSLSGVVGDISDPTRVPSQSCDQGQDSCIDTSRWCSYVTSAAEIRNKWTERVVCVGDDGTVTTADFSPGTIPSPNGFRLSSIKNAVATHAGADALWAEADTYAYIDVRGDEPIPYLVAPILDRRGIGVSISSLPDGAVVFSPGADGGANIEVLDDVAAGVHPGPIAGFRSAENVRTALNHQFGFYISQKPTRSTQTVQTTSEIGETVEFSDPNLANATEFVLQRQGRAFAVTPLTSYGSSTTITAYLEVAVDEIANGQAPQATLYRLPEPEAANTTISNTIRVLYGQDLSEADVIYEITPAAQGVSRISIGREDQIRFVARSETVVSNGLLVGEICVASRTGRQVNCSQLDADPWPLGTLVSTASDSVSASAPFQGDLAAVPTQALLDELERRLDEAGAN